jgi:hypothetical protein
MNFGDIPLKDAMIAWNPRPRGDGRIVVIPYPDHASWTDRLKLSDTTGACWSHWGTWSPQDRLARLLLEAWCITCRDGLEPRAIHEAFMVIPEYRETVEGESFFWSSKARDEK